MTRLKQLEADLAAAQADKEQLYVLLGDALSRLAVCEAQLVMLMQHTEHPPKYSHGFLDEIRSRGLKPAAEPGHPHVEQTKPNDKGITGEHMPRPRVSPHENPLESHPARSAHG